uniref:Uncharacterized protein n=1 Tax=Candidatus Kentrum eta TaxID=2126337 RepID=A0A450UKX2_9GAMM|nr:MAG: hypothetical protein BECKH772A_GA0070896_1005318 [Candidatus Kentron sp. H]VFJ94066.1 MAG: hypothetical protein BECKH772B_GA0070898_1005418 [Candidatus Kentron sp. H]VFK00729.1 MAG: hypothetical protein BECKH772C_GA0070978_1005118 [Candidatus Kentron sp. H]
MGTGNQRPFDSPLHIADVYWSRCVLGDLSREPNPLGRCCFRQTYSPRDFFAQAKIRIELERWYPERVASLFFAL